jgi:cytosine/adenosine deaminase-related metal-dependent hydrolase
MANQNVTLSISEETLRMAKHLAVEKGTSLSRLLSEHLEEIVRTQDRFERARTSALARMKRGLPMGVGGRARWTRDDLHGR